VPFDRLVADSANAAEFGRTLSRLEEMRSRDYLEAAHKARANATKA